MTMKNAIVLCSGGIDSVVTANYVKKNLKYDKITLLFFDYGQRGLVPERKYSKKCSKDLRAEFYDINLDFLSKLSESIINVKSKKFNKISRSDLKNSKVEGNKYYVPYRNSIFLVSAMALAEKLFEDGKGDIFVGFQSEGVEAYPDTTQEFVNSINDLAKKGKFNGKIFSPLIKMDKNEIVKIGEKLKVDFRDTFSCYTSNLVQCGVCLSCRLRQEAFYWANILDPSKYKKKMDDFRIASD